MRIACLQFAPRVGDVDNNLNRADAVLSRANPKDIDLLVLPELAFSGYNFRSLQHITPYLEPTSAGITSLWARTTALKYNCIVAAGYPEKVDVAPKWPAGPEYYNSAIIVNSEGETIGNYRKSFLYYTDETWALEGSGFFNGAIEGLGGVAMGICMDLNPYKFEAPWNAWEFAHHCLRVRANLVILSMAWLTREDARSYSRVPREPDMETLSYWLARLEPLIRAEAEGEIIVIFANRCGIEDEAVYAGTSAVLGINAGEVKVYGILGRGEKELLVVDTNKRPQAKLVSEKSSLASVVGGNTSQPDGGECRPDKAHSIDKNYPSSVNDDEDYEDTDDEEYGKEYNDPYGFSPVSPTDPRFPQAYFGRKQSSYGGSKPRDSLISSVGTPSPTSQRPPEPKSRNASRNRQRGESTCEQDRILPPLERPLDKSFGPVEGGLKDELLGWADQKLEPDLATNIGSDPGLSNPVSKLDAEFINKILEPVHEIIDPSSATALVTMVDKGPVAHLAAGFDDEPSQFSDIGLASAGNLDPALAANIGREPIFGQFQPHSASGMDGEESSFTHNELGPRSTHVSARPRSTVW